MNPLTNVRNITKLNEQELKFGIFDSGKSWHSQYKDSAYIFVGGLPFELTEGDILCVFSQYGEIININLVRDKKTGKSKGYGFLAYEDQRSTILAVDNFNGIKLGGRTIRVDHVQDYRRPKGDEKDESGKYKEIEELGCAPKTPSGSEEESEDEKREKRKKSKKGRKEKKMKKAKKKEKKKEDHDERHDSVRRSTTELPKNKFQSGEMKPDMTTKGSNKNKVVERGKLETRVYKEKREDERGYKYREKERSRQLERDYTPSKHKIAHHRSSHEKYDRARDRPKDRHRSRSPFYGR